VRNRSHDKNRLREQLRAFVESRPEILFAYLHGSFIVDDLPFNDIDLGIYVEPGVLERRSRFDLEANLAIDFSRKLGVEVDVHLLNDAPIAFAHSVLRGEPLFSRNDKTLLEFVERVGQEWCEFEHLFRQGLEDVLK